MPDVTDLLDDPDVGGGQPFQVERTTGTRANGKKVPGVPVVHKTTGNIQPAQPKELERLPEEDRVKAIVAIRSTFTFQTGSDDGGKAYTDPDVIIISGIRYRVLKIDDWSAYGFHCAFATQQ
jgi:hypothetical protein